MTDVTVVSVPGRYLPACLMAQTGTRDTGSPLAAFRISSFFNGGNACKTVLQSDSDSNNLNGLNRKNMTANENPLQMH